MEEVLMAKNAYTEQGFTGLSEFSGIIQADFLREWRGKEAYKRANEMRLNSPVVSAMLYSIEQSVRVCSWSFTSDNGQDDPRLEICQRSWREMKGGPNNHISEALTMLPFGFALFEQVYKRDGGLTLIDKLAVRGQDTVWRWLLSPNGDILGFEQVTESGQRAPLMSDKLLHYRIRVERNNPEGRSILRTAWIPYYFQKHIQQIEAIGIERDLAGLPVIKLPPGADTNENSTSSDASKAAKVVRNLRNDEQAGLVLPEGWEFELASTGGSRAFDTDKVIRRYESRILMSALSQFLLLGQDGVGSLALSKDQTDLFVMSVNAVADVIAETFTAQVLPNLMRLNGYDATGLRLEHTPAGDVDVAAVSAFLQAVGDKVTWSAEDETWLRGIGGLPERAPEDIQAERDKAEERRAEMIKAISAKTERENQDQMSADYFGATPPDERKRRKAEKEYQDALERFLTSQKKRILKEAKALKNG